MNIILWILQVLLAGAFGMAGSLKLFQPIEELALQMPFVADLAPILVRFIGLVEVLGAIGLILPAVTRILPKFTPLAGAGLSLTVILAVWFHLMRGEATLIFPPLILAVLSAFAAYGRWKLIPIEPK